MGREININCLLEIVGMLPDIDSKERDEASGGLEWVLVGAGGYLQALVSLNKCFPYIAT